MTVLAVLVLVTLALTDPLRSRAWAAVTVGSGVLLGAVLLLTALGFDGGITV